MKSEGGGVYTPGKWGLCPIAPTERERTSFFSYPENSPRGDGGERGEV
jgi:hypothetical protein